MADIKLIHPETNVIRTVASTHGNKLRILKRVGFVPLEGYKFPKAVAILEDPSLAEVLEEQRDPDDLDTGLEVAAEMAIHDAPKKAVKKKKKKKKKSASKKTLKKSSLSK